MCCDLAAHSSTATPTCSSPPATAPSAVSPPALPFGRSRYSRRAPSTCAAAAGHMLRRARYLCRTPSGRRSSHGAVDAGTPAGTAAHQSLCARTCVQSVWVVLLDCTAWQLANNRLVPPHAPRSTERRMQHVAQTCGHEGATIVNFDETIASRMHTARTLFAQTFTRRSSVTAIFCTSKWALRHAATV